MKKPLVLLAFLLAVVIVLNGAIDAPERTRRALALAGLEADDPTRTPCFLDVELSSTLAYGPRILGAPSLLMKERETRSIDLAELGGRGSLEIRRLDAAPGRQPFMLRLLDGKQVLAEGRVVLEPDATFRLDPRQADPELNQLRRLLCATTSVELALRARSL